MAKCKFSSFNQHRKASSPYSACLHCTFPFVSTFPSPPTLSSSPHFHSRPPSAWNENRFSPRARLSSWLNLIRKLLVSVEFVELKLTPTHLSIAINRRCQVKTSFKSFVAFSEHEWRYSTNISVASWHFLLACSLAWLQEQKQKSQSPRAMKCKTRNPTQSDWNKRNKSKDDGGEKGF